MSSITALILLGVQICSAATPVRVSCVRQAPPRQHIRAAVDPDEGYGPIGSLIRQGPVPFVQRISNPTKYEGSVMYYMQENKCSRAEAQGNIDAYLANPNDWALIKMRAKKGGFEPDFANANTDPKQLALSGIWAAGVIFLAYRVALVQLFNGAGN
jgi:hypothetical protein